MLYDDEEEKEKTETFTVLLRRETPGTEKVTSSMRVAVKATSRNEAMKQAETDMPRWWASKCVLGDQTKS